MNRLLLFLVPDKQATILAWALSVIALLIGVLDMMSRDFDSAQFHLNLSIGIMAFLFVLKFLTMRATYQVAENARHRLHQHIKNIQKSPLPANQTEAQVQAHEKAQMTELVSELKHALDHIAPDSPARPKYEATLEMMNRMNSRASSTGW
jgi:hypothetical protein